MVLKEFYKFSEIGKNKVKPLKSFTGSLQTKWTPSIVKQIFHTAFVSIFLFVIF